MAATTLQARILLTARDKTGAALKGTQANIRQVGQAVTSVQSQFLALAGIGGFGALLAGTIRTNAEMQTLKSSLKTVTGSTEAARAAFAKIEKFAVTTPFDLNEWTQAFIKMKSLGLDPSEAALTSYGNTAAAMGKSLNQMIEAVADAATGEFERLKEFGIKSSREGDQVRFTFQGITTQIGNNAGEITRYLQGIGNTQFAGAMTDQMDNLSPAFSNLKQSFATLAVTIGEAGLNDMILGITRSVTDFTNSFTDTRKETIRAFFADIKSVAGDVAEAFKAIAWLQGDGMLQQWQANNPSQIGNMAPAIQGGYRLGDFNRSNGNADYLNVLRTIEDKQTGNANAANLREQRTTNDLLRQTVDAIKQQSGVAVAG